MPTNLELLLEAEKRGLLPQDKLDALKEARRRGIVQQEESPKFSQARESYTKYGGVPAAAPGQEAPLAIPRPGTPTGLPAGAGEVVSETPREETTLAGIGGALSRAAFPAEVMAGAGALGAAALGAPVAAGAALGLGAYGVSKALGVDQGFVSELEKWLTSKGVAEPKTAAERMVQSAATGGVDVAAQLAGAGAIPKTAGALTQGFRSLMLEQPTAQLAAGVGSSAAAQAANELGASQGTQLAAALIGGVAGGMAGARIKPQATAVEQAAGWKGIRDGVPLAEAEAQAERLISLTSGKKPPPAPPPVEPPAPPTTTAQATGARYVEPGELAAKMEAAAKPGAPGLEARMWLKTLANQDEKAMAAAQKLGVELPPDVYARQPQIREIAGLDRSQKGTVASAIWRDTVAESAQKLDEKLSSLGAKFTQEGPAITQVADEVKSTLTKKIEELSSQADTAYAKIRERVPEDARGAASDTLAFIAERAKPREVRPGAPKSATSPFEERVKKALTPTRETYMDPLTLNQVTRETFPTYTTIDDLRKEAGRGLKGQGPFKDEATGVLKAFYKTLTDDQERISSRFNTADLWKQAKDVVSERKALEDAATSAFGSELKNSIAPALKSAVKGDVNAATRIMPVLNAVPDTLRREAFLTAIADASRATSGRLKGEFGVTQFPDVYRAMRRSKDWPEFAKVLGSEGVQTLDAVFKVSKIISQASGELTGTGASLQKVVNERNAASLVEKFLTSNIGRFVGGMTAPGRVITEFLDSARKKRIELTINVFRSPEMESIMRETAKTGEPSPEAVRKMITSNSFVQFAKEAKLPRDLKNRELWIREAIRASRTRPSQTEEQPE